MTDVKKKNIIWVDDYISQFNGYISALESSGFNVLKKEDVHDVAVEELDFVDIFIIDSKFGQLGFDVGDKYAREFARKRKNKKIIMFSAYLESSDIEKTIEIDDNKNITLYVPKKMVPVSGYDDNVKRFIEKIVALFESNDVENILEKIKSIDGVDELSTSYDKYAKLPQSDQFEYLSKVRKDLSNVINNYLEKGYNWLLFFEGERSPARKYHSVSDGLSDDQIQRLAEQKRKVPLKIVVVEKGEDIGCRGAHPRKDMHIYPVARLELGKSDKFIDFHFDTGSDYNFINVRVLSEIGLIQKGEPYSLRLGSGWDNEYMVIEANFDAAIVAGSETGENKRFAGTILGHIVHGWENKNLIVHCDNECGGFFMHNTKKICGVRFNGLLGRNIIEKFKVDILLKYGSQVVYPSRSEMKK